MCIDGMIVERTTRLLPEGMTLEERIRALIRAQLDREELKLGLPPIKPRLRGFAAKYASKAEEKAAQTEDEPEPDRASDYTLPGAEPF